VPIAARRGNRIEPTLPPSVRRKKTARRHPKQHKRYPRTTDTFWRDDCFFLRRNDRSLSAYYTAPAVDVNSARIIDTQYNITHNVFMRLYYYYHIIVVAYSTIGGGGHSLKHKYSSRAMSYGGYYYFIPADDGCSSRLLSAPVTRGPNTRFNALQAPNSTRRTHKSTAAPWGAPNKTWDVRSVSDYVIFVHIPQVRVIVI